MASAMARCLSKVQIWLWKHAYYQTASAITCIHSWWPISNSLVVPAYSYVLEKGTAGCLIGNKVKVWLPETNLKSHWRSLLIMISIWLSTLWTISEILVIEKCYFGLVQSIYRQVKLECRLPKCQARIFIFASTASGNVYSLSTEIRGNFAKPAGYYGQGTSEDSVGEAAVDRIPEEIKRFIHFFYQHISEQVGRFMSSCHIFVNFLSYPLLLFVLLQGLW